MLSNSPFDFWAYAQGARYNTFAFRGAQMDRYGNVNNTVIGPFDKPKVRLPGGGGMADLSCMIPHIYLWTTTHDPRTFVDQLDFRSGIGWGDGGDHRARLGLPGGPQLLRHEPVRLRLRARVEARCGCARSTPASASTRCRRPPASSCCPRPAGATVSRR